jgi:hypothetical protein
MFSRIEYLPKNNLIKSESPYDDTSKFFKNGKNKKALEFLCTGRLVAKDEKHILYLGKVKFLTVAGDDLDAQVVYDIQAYIWDVDDGECEFYDEEGNLAVEIIKIVNNFLSLPINK